jgi:hypothetical protein
MLPRTLGDSELIRHCVFLRFRAEVTRAERLAIYDAIAALKQRIAGMIDVQAGANASPEGLDKGFAEGFIVTFENAASRDAYLVDEEHAKVGARIVAAVEGGIDGVFVFDLETDS